MLQPIKIALGEYLARYYGSVVATTKPLESFVTRGVAKSVLWVPARMIDAAEEMLALLMRTDLNGAPTKPPELPAILVAMSKDYTPTGRDYTRQVADNVNIIIPGDPKERLFGLRAAAGDIRVQVVIFATDEPSARSLAAQFMLFLDGTDNRRFDATYHFAGQNTDWPVQIESPENLAISVATDAKNLTILAIDFMLHASIPLFDAPAEGIPNDGQGVPGTADPAGYQTVQLISGTSLDVLDADGGDVLGTWSVMTPAEAAAQNGP